MAFSPVNKTIYFQSPDEVTFKAYYPYTGVEGTAPQVVEKTLTADDQKVANQPKIDFLFASGATGSKANPDVNFSGDHAFKHCMSQLTITFKEGADITFGSGKFTKFTISELKMDGTFDPNTGAANAKATAPNGDLAIPLTGVTTNAGTYKASPLILFPQQVTSGKFKLSVTVEGQTYNTVLNLPATSANDLKPGYNYTYTITVRKTGLEVGSASIKDWTPIAGADANAEM